MKIAETAGWMTVTVMTIIVIIIAMKAKGMNVIESVAGNAVGIVKMSTIMMTVRMVIVKEIQTMIGMMIKSVNMMIMMPRMMTKRWQMTMIRREA